MDNYETYIYNALATQDNIFYGLIAFSIYMTEKKVWIEEHRPSENELKDHLMDILDNKDGALDKYRKDGIKEGKKILTKLAQDNFPNHIINNIKEQVETALKTQSTRSIIEQESLLEIKEQLVVALKEQPKTPKKKLFWFNVWASCVGTAIFAALPYIILIISYLSNPEITKQALRYLWPFN